MPTNINMEDVMVRIKRKESLTNDQINQELLEACKAALLCISRLIPFRSGPELDIVAKAIDETADYADGIRGRLRIAIGNTEKG